MTIIKVRKLHEDSDTLIIDEFRLGSGGSFKIKDYRGFTVAEIDQTGNLKIKGTVKKI